MVVIVEVWYFFHHMFLWDSWCREKEGLLKCLRDEVTNQGPIIITTVQSSQKQIAHFVNLFLIHIGWNWVFVLVLISLQILVERTSSSFRGTAYSLPIQNYGQAPQPEARARGSTVFT